MASIKDMIKAKEEKKLKTDIPLNDINKSLILSLFSIALYGKEAHDEEILSIIIGANKSEEKEALVADFERKKKEYGASMKMGKAGYYVHNGLLVLHPKNN